MLSLRDSFVSVDVLLYIGYISSLDFSRFQQMQFHFSFRLHTELFGCCWDKTKKKEKIFLNFSYTVYTAFTYIVKYIDNVILYEFVISREERNWNNNVPLLRHAHARTAVKVKVPACCCINYNSILYDELYCFFYYNRLDRWNYR